MCDDRPMHRPDRAGRALVRASAVLLGSLLLAACGGTTPPATTGAPSVGPTIAPSGVPSGVPSVPASGGQQFVAFPTGSATLKLTGSETSDLKLGEIVSQDAAASGWDAVDGTSVVWRESAKGWYLSIQGFYGTGDQKTSDSSFVAITAPDGRQVQDVAGACTVHVKTSTPSAFQGSLDCTALSWQDENGDPTGQPFGASGTFSAAP